MTEDCRSAEILWTDLGHVHKGLLTFWIQLDYGGVGGYYLGTDKNPVGGEFFIVFLSLLLKTLEVDTWEELSGTFCRVKYNSQGGVCAIGHPLKDEWVDLNSLLDSCLEDLLK